MAIMIQRRRRPTCLDAERDRIFANLSKVHVFTASLRLGGREIQAACFAHGNRLDREYLLDRLTDRVTLKSITDGLMLLADHENDLFVWDQPAEIGGRIERGRLCRSAVCIVEERHAVFKIILHSSFDRGKSRKPGRVQTEQKTGGRGAFERLAVSGELEKRVFERSAVPG